MIQEVEEITKEIDSFKTNLMGLNGIINYVREINGEIKKNTEVFAAHLGRLEQQRQELKSLRNDLLETDKMLESLTMQSKENNKKLESLAIQSIEADNKLESLVMQSKETDIKLGSLAMQLKETNNELELSVRYSREFSVEINTALKKIAIRFNILCALSFGALLLAIFAILK